MLLFGCDALHKPSLHGIGWLRAPAYASFVFRILVSNSGGRTTALQRLTLPTYRWHFRVERLFTTPPSSKCKCQLVNLS